MALGLVFGRFGLEFFELKLHLVEKPRLTLARPVKLAPHLLDGEPQMRDQSSGPRDLGARPRQFGLRAASNRFNISTSHNTPLL
jgi:hypothetical protein